MSKKHTETNIPALARTSNLNEELRVNLMEMYVISVKKTLQEFSDVLPYVLAVLEFNLLTGWLSSFAKSVYVDGFARADGGIYEEIFSRNMIGFKIQGIDLVTHKDNKC
ncbi:hypothetical protein L2E82_40907 [Cichorium intybus]|uniref:Uncharacterized protein n=1 Tax=Cichorium intybus TaxID=13427 RepID=A0ACB9ARL8_CICIN|nr:hypothetical protein L2E82_40907 [Cichorium intybus]